VAQPAATSKGKGAGLTKKIGPLPAWAWGVLVLAVVAFFFLRSRGSSAAGETPSGSPLASGTGGDSGGASGGGDNSQPSTIPVGSTGNPTTSPGSTGDLGPTTTVTPDAAPSTQPASAFPNPFQPVSTAPSAPGSDYLTGGVASHPGTVGTTGGYVTPNNSVLPEQTTPTNVHRPGVQL